MTASARPQQVLIAGGGIAALELLLALRVLAGSRVAITLLSASADFAPPAMTVAEPFERGGARTYDWSQIAEHEGARLVIDTLVAVDTAQRIVFTHGGRRVRYDVLALATGARRVEPFSGALTFGVGSDAAPDLRALVAKVLASDTASVAFALPSPSSWPLPLWAGSPAAASCTTTRATGRPPPAPSTRSHSRPRASRRPPRSPTR